jgi:hypothetical protein
MIVAKKNGPKSVTITNHLVRTRSRYSRLMTAQSLAMSAHPLFDAGGADALQEDLVQRGLHLLESLDARAGLEHSLEQHLRIGATASSISKYRLWSSARSTSARSRSTR